MFLKPQVRYSEDIDLVQINSGSIGDVLTLLRKKLSFLGKAKYIATKQSVKLIFDFESEMEPVVKLKLKIEINAREHFSIFGFENINYSLNNEWFGGECKITTYSLEELLSTKLRALYQRKKGRDLFDLYYAFEKSEPNSYKIVKGLRKYLQAEGLKVTEKEFISNVEGKILDTEFVGDTLALLRPNIHYSPVIAWHRIKKRVN